MWCVPSGGVVITERTAVQAFYVIGPVFSTEFRPPFCGGATQALAANIGAAPYYSRNFRERVRTDRLGKPRVYGTGTARQSDYVSLIMM